MKMIRKIALAEFKYLFYSPVAWFIVLVFYILSAALFFDWLDRMASGLDQGLELIDDFPGWLAGILGSMRYETIYPLLKYLYMFFPLLTMGVFNRENNSGSIKLLYSSPIRNREIILGKYLGIIYFNLILLIGTAILLFTCVLIVENSHIVSYLSILLGFFVLVNTYAAIGLFFSCLTNYQIVAAVLTFVVIYVLETVGDFGQKYDIIRDITYFLSISNKPKQLMSGLVSSQNICYFILIVTLFLLFAMIRLRSVRQSKSWRQTVYQYIFVFLGVLVMGYFTSIPSKISYIDLTKNKTNSLHPSTQEVLKQFDGSPLKVTLYTNLFTKFNKFGFPEQRNNYIWHFWQNYVRYYPNIQLDYVYYYAIPEGDSTLYKQYPGKRIDEIAELRAETHDVRKSIFKPATFLVNLDELRAEDFKSVMKLEYKGKYTYLRTMMDGGVWPNEINVSGSLMRLIRDKKVAVTFVTGNYERNPFRNTPRDYGQYTTHKFFLHSLIDRGVDIDTISLKQKDVPNDVQLLVVADPRVPYTQTELDRLYKYVKGGGNAIFMAEPNKQFILNPLLEKLGVIVEDGILIKTNKKNNAHVIASLLTTSGLLMSTELERFQLFKELGRGLYHNEAAPLTFKEVDGFKVEKIAIAKHDHEMWLKKGVYVKDSIAPVFNSLEGDIKMDEYVIGVALTRQVNNKEQRIIITGDADFMSSGSVDPKGLNHHFYSWGLDNKYPIFAIDPLNEDRLLKIDRDQVDMLKKVYLYVLPTLLFLFSYRLLVRRRKK